MRRGKLNKSTYVYLLLSAFFTIFAYISDQLVINFENKNRILSIDYDDTQTEIKSLNALENNLENYGMQIDNLFYSELKNRNFYIKNIYEIENNKDFRQLFIDDRSIENLKFDFVNSTIQLILNIDKVYENYYNLSYDDTYLSFENDILKNFSDKIIELDKILEFNLDKFNNKSVEELNKLLENDFSNYALSDWMDIRNIRLVYLETLFNETNKIEPFIENLEKTIEDKELDLEIKFKNIKSTNNFINYFILSGIISQILTLFFLLLLFRSLLLNKQI